MRAVWALVLTASLVACGGAGQRKAGTTAGADRDPTARAPCPSCPSVRGFVNADGALLKMQVTGSLADGRPVVVFVHDWAHDGTFFYQQAAGLRSRFTVVTYDLRGHGASTDDARAGADIAGHAADLAAVLAAVEDEAGKRPVHLVGHGLGAWIALAAAVTTPERLRSLTLISAARAWSSDVRAAYRAMAERQRKEPTSYRGWTNRLLPVWVAAPTLEARGDVIAFYDFVVARLDPASAASTLALAVDHEVAPETLAAVDLPILLLYGELDAFPGRASDERFFAGAPDATQLRIPGASRDAPLEAPNSVNMALARFFAAAQ